MGRVAVSICLAAMGAGGAHALQLKGANEGVNAPFKIALRDGPDTKAAASDSASVVEDKNDIQLTSVWKKEPSEAPVSPTAVTLSSEQALVVAERLYQKGEHASALKILAELKKANAPDVDQTQVAFLLGMIALDANEFVTAVDLFRGIIDRSPELVRVRLELARALFALKEDRAAAYHFRLALADEVSPEAQANIRQFLRVIEQRKIWRINAQIAAAPDSNVSAGPKDKNIQLFGLPFELDDNATRRSGLGLTTSLNAEFFPKISEKFRLEVRGGGTFSDYENADFDDLFLFAEAGPRYVSDDFSASTLATYSRRFFGNEGYRTTVGGKLNLSKGLTSRTVMNFRFSGAHARYDVDTSRNGPVYSAGANATHALNKISTLRIGVGATREQTESQDLRNTQYLLNTSYRRELPLGVTIQTGPEIYYRQFDNFNSIDNVTRNDWTYGGSVYFTKRDWRLYGFAPIFSYQYLRNESNADRFDYTRHRANVGFTRVF